MYYSICFLSHRRLANVFFFTVGDNNEPLTLLSPHDALKHHFTSLKTDLIFIQTRVLERKFPRNWFTNTW